MQISVLSLGGTISMLSDSTNGATPKLDAQKLLSTICLDGMQITAHTLFALPSPSLGYAHIFSALDRADALIKDGADAIVLTQGTDTLEESAFLLSLLWHHQAPLVITGAMKPSGELGEDGASNLSAALLVAASAKSRGRGVLAVFNHTIYEPRFLHKSHSFCLQTFVSLNGGNIGYIYENTPRYLVPAYRARTYHAPSAITKRVAILPAYIDGDAQHLALLDEYDGIIIDGFGAGHVSAAAASALLALLNRRKDLVIIITTRTGSGPSAKATYGYAGSEMDLQSLGCIMGGFFDALKARLLLSVLLELGYTKPQIAKEFDEFYEVFDE